MEWGIKREKGSIKWDVVEYKKRKGEYKMGWSGV